MDVGGDGSQTIQRLTGMIREQLPSLLPTLAFLVSFFAFMTLLFLDRLTESKIAFAVSLWAIAYSLVTICHRRYAGIRGRLSQRFLTSRASESDRLLFSEYLDRKRLDLFLYPTLFALASFSVATWWPSILGLPLVFSLALFFDRKVLSIILPTSTPNLSDAAWLGILVVQPAGNLPLLVQWWRDTDPGAMIILALVFWSFQLAGLALLLHLHWKRSG